MEGDKGEKSYEIKRRRSNGFIRPRFTIDGANIVEDTLSQTSISSENEAQIKKRRQTFMHSIPENSDTTDGVTPVGQPSVSPDSQSMTSAQSPEDDVTPRRGRSQSFLSNISTVAIGATSAKASDTRSNQSPVSKKGRLKIPGPSKNAKTLSLPNPYVQQQQPSSPAFERTLLISAEIRNDQRSPSDVQIDISSSVFNRLNDKVKEKFKVAHFLAEEFTASDDFATIDKIASKQALKSMSKDQKKQQNILLEFLNSERKQTFNLKLMIQVFEPVLRSSANASSNSGAYSSLAMFPEIAKLIDFHFTFYTRLLSCVTSDYVIQDVGPVFIEMFERSDYRSKFAEYYIWISCKNLKPEKVRKLEEDYRSLLKKRSLQDLLASEFQRATKYKLLLEGVLTCCVKSGGAEKSLFEQALNSVTSLVAGIDKDKGLQDYRLFVSKVDRSEIIREHPVENKDQSNESGSSSEVSIAEMKSIRLQDSEPIKYGTYFVLFKFLSNKHKHDSIHVNIFKKCLILFFPSYLIFIESDHFTEKLTWKTYLDKDKLFKSVISINDIRHVTSHSTKSLNEEQAEMVKDQASNFTCICETLFVIVYVPSPDDKTKWKDLLKEKTSQSWFLRQRSFPKPKVEGVKYRERLFTKRQPITPPPNNGSKESPVFDGNVFEQIARPLSVIVTDLDAANLDFNNRSNFRTDIHQSKSTEDANSLKEEKQFFDSNSDTKKKNSVKTKAKIKRVSVSMSDISYMAAITNSDGNSDYEETEDNEFSDSNNLSDYKTADGNFVESESSPEKCENRVVENTGTESEVEDSNPLPEIITTEYSNVEVDMSTADDDTNKVSDSNPQMELSISVDKRDSNAGLGQSIRNSKDSIKKRLSFFGSSRFYTGSVNLDRSRHSSDSDSNDECVDDVDSKFPANPRLHQLNEDENFSPEALLLIQNLDEKVKSKFKVCDYRSDTFSASHDFTTVDKLVSKEILESMTEMQKRQQNILLQFLNNERKQTVNLKLIIQVFEPILRSYSNTSNSSSGNNSLALFPEIAKLIDFHFTFYTRLLSCVTSDYVIQDVGPVFIDMFENLAYRTKFAKFYEWSGQFFYSDEMQRIEGENEISLKGRKFHDLMNSEAEIVENYERLVTDIQDSATGCPRNEARFLLRVSAAVSSEVESIKKFKRNFEYTKLIRTLELTNAHEKHNFGGDYLETSHSDDACPVDLRNTVPILYGLHFVLVDFPRNEGDASETSDRPELKKFLVILFPRILVLVESNPESGKLCWSPHIDEEKTISSTIPVESIQQVTSTFSVSLDDFQIEIVENRLLNFSCICNTGLQLIIFLSTLEEKNNWMSMIEEARINVGDEFSRSSSIEKSETSERSVSKKCNVFSTSGEQHRDDANSSIDASSFNISGNANYSTSVHPVASSTLKPKGSSTTSLSYKCIPGSSTDERLAKISELRSQVVGILKESLDLARSVFNPENSLEPEKLIRAHRFVVDDELLGLVDKETWLKLFDSPSLPYQTETSDVTDINDVFVQMNGDNEKEVLSEISDQIDNPNSLSGQCETTGNLSDDAIEKGFRKYFQGKSDKRGSNTSLTMGLKSITGTVINSIYSTSENFAVENQNDCCQMSSSVVGPNVKGSNGQDNEMAEDEDSPLNEPSVKTEDDFFEESYSETEDDYTEEGELETDNDENDLQKLEKSGFEPHSEKSGENGIEVVVSQQPHYEAATDMKVDADNGSIDNQELASTGLCNNMDDGLEEAGAKTGASLDESREQEADASKITGCRVPTYIDYESSYESADDSGPNTDDQNLEDLSADIEKEDSVPEKLTTDDQERETPPDEKTNLFSHQQSVEEQDGTNELEVEV